MINKLKLRVAAMVFIAALCWGPYLLLLTIPTIGVGCAAVQEGSDPVVVRAQQAQSLSLQILDSFVLYEYNNRGALLAVSPEIKKAADNVRKRAPMAFESLSNALATYKANRTPENKANLVTYLAVVEQLQAEAVKWLATARTQPPTPPQ